MELSNNEKKVLYVFEYLMKQVGYDNLYQLGKEEKKEVNSNYIMYKGCDSWILLNRNDNNKFGFQEFPNLHSLCLNIFTMLDNDSCDYCINNFISLLNDQTKQKRR